MKYIVRKPMPGAKVDQILEVGNGNGNLYYEEDVFPGSLIVLHENQVRVALDQGFIEPYEEKPKKIIDDFTRKNISLPTSNRNVRNAILQLEEAILALTDNEVSDE